MKTLCAALLGLTFLLHAHAASPAPSLVVEQDQARILALAEKALFMPPDSLTQHPSPLNPGTAHEFFSMSDYFWPDPDKPDGRPYIMRDGQSNPENFNEHRKALMAMRDATSALSSAYLLTQDEKYAQKAVELLRVFFLDPATRMHPSLDHAQAIIGKSTPDRGTGLIDTLHLIEVPLSILALKDSKAMTPETLDALRQWFTDYTKWFVESTKGKNEAKAKNNHAVAYWLQVAAFATLTGDAALLAECRHQFKEVFLAVQLAPDGGFPLELGRTKPYAYSIFQLDNMAALCQLLSTQSDNLWTYTAPDGRCMARAVAYLHPYLADKSAWPLKPDIHAWAGWPVRQPALLFGGIAFHEDKYLQLWRTLKTDPQDFEIRRNNAITQPLLWTTLLPPSSPASAAAPKKPNVLYIFADDLTVRAVSCYPQASPWVKTPNMDALAAKGVRFHSVYMAAYCIPSRVSMMTGNLPHAAQGNFTGPQLTGESLKQEIAQHPFWPQRLRESGYRTGIIGKWHISSRPPALGIDWDTAIHWSKSLVNAYYYGQKMIFNGSAPTSLDGYSVDRHTDLAIDFMKALGSKDKPWFLWLCYSSPHKPADPAERHKGALAAVTDIPEPASMKLRDGKPAYIRDYGMPRWKGVQEAIRQYHECVMAIDENVGRLTKALQETDQLSNTVIIFTGDQGLAHGQHGLVSKKDAPYDAALCSPLIFSWPGHYPQGRVSEEPVSGPDMVKTLHEIMGLTPLASMDGTSLLPAVKDPDCKLARDAMLMTNVQNHMGERIPEGVKKTERIIARGGKGEAAMPDWAMIRSGVWKYVCYCGDAKEEELYNLAEDPEEIINLALLPAHRARLEQLRLACARQLRATQSGFSSGHYIDFFPLLKDLPAN
ncbi:alginate lyase family protein [Prosthecobacter sp.]|uniref:alginate lyase family protein n=1 Tax=Prosthecobacter sp. TaxID=1965333 RepID=UPI0037850AEB